MYNPVGLGLSYIHKQAACVRHRLLENCTEALLNNNSTFCCVKLLMHQMAALACTLFMQEPRGCVRLECMQVLPFCASVCCMTSCQQKWTSAMCNKSGSTAMYTARSLKDSITKQAWIRFRKRVSESTSTKQCWAAQRCVMQHCLTNKLMSLHTYFRLPKQTADCKYWCTHCKNSTSHCKVSNVISKRQLRCTGH